LFEHTWWFGFRKKKLNNRLKETGKVEIEDVNKFY
jgi:hypothetical protein